jgi:hypothetical protein
MTFTAERKYERLQCHSVSVAQSRRLKHRALCSLPLLAVLTLGLSGQVLPSGSDLPSKQQVLAFLSESIDWYRHCAVERQIATEPVDLVFLEDNRPIATQILQLAFEFARVDARIAATFPSGTQTGSNAVAGGSSPEMAEFVQAEKTVELGIQQESQEIDAIKKKLQTARKSDHRELQAALDAAQSRLGVLQSGSASLRQLIESVRAIAGETGDLASSIEDLARTVPEVAGPTATVSQTPNSATPSLTRPKNSGILGLSSEVSALGGKLRIVDDEIRRTDKLRQSSNDLRNPLLASIKKRFPTGPENELQGNDLRELEQKKARLDAVRDLVNAVSPAVLALYKQSVLLDVYTAHLRSWRAAVVAEVGSTWKNLILRLVGAALLISALVIIGAVGRRGTRRHVHDAERRHILLVIQRVVLWFIIVFIAAFACASDLTSLATFFGLLAAGVAFALQSFIIAALSYFVLVSRHGIRIGDRVQISEVIGDVTDIGWLQLRLREIDKSTQQATGRMVTFSNSFVLLSPATGLYKFNESELKRTQMEAAAKACQP